MIASKTFLRDLIYVHKVARKPSDVSTQKDPFATGPWADIPGQLEHPGLPQDHDFEWDVLPNPSGSQPAKNYAGPDMISVYGKSKAKEAAQKFVQYAVFNREAQELIGTTGAPVLTDYLTDKTRIETRRNSSLELCLLRRPSLAERGGLGVRAEVRRHRQDGE